MRQLTSHAASKDAPRHVIHYTYFGRREAADHAANQLSLQGWLCEVRHPLPGYPDEWRLVCEQHNVLLTPAFVSSSAQMFEDVAGRYGGDYDGWEASV